MKNLSSISWPVLGKHSQREFLEKFWQKRPLLMKGALKPFPDLISPDEVAGLSCDPRVESRLIMEKGGKTPWELRRGPFKPSLFSKLPKTHWTILVNGVDRFVPAINAFVDNFSFIPFWRIDDVMISVAYDQGNVGAHVDNYDVFLVQAHGTREWMIEDRAVLEDDFVPGLPIRLLRKFKPTHRWLLEPGDILYLPPRFPHHGIARGDRCMTISVGFRAPSIHDLVNGVVTEALSTGDESERYCDPELSPQAPGEITPETIKKIKGIITKQVANDSLIESWLSRYVTESYCDVELNAKRRAPKLSVIRKAISDGAEIARAEGARCAFVRTSNKSEATAKNKKAKASEIRFYANGERFDLGGKAALLAAEIANRVVVPNDIAKPLVKDAKAAGLLAELIGRGIVVLE
jgi:50S ribosomal protein L16 3-hydroxylase